MALPLFLTLDQMLKNAPGASAAQMFTIFRESRFLDSLSFMQEPGAAKSWETDANLPPTERRALNQDFTLTGGGRTSLDHESLRLYGGAIREDEAARKMGITRPSRQNALSIKSLRLTLEVDAIFGDPSADPLVVAGTQFHAENSGDTAQTSQSAGSTANGEPLSVFRMREAQDSCMNFEKVLMGQTMLNRLSGADHDTGVGGFITHTEDDLGRKVTRWDGRPIITAERDSSQVPILDFTEAADSGTPTATSIYFLGADYTWFQNGPPDITELPQAGSQLPRRILWLLANFAPRYSVVRLKHIANAPVVK